MTNTSPEPTTEGGFVATYGDDENDPVRATIRTIAELHERAEGRMDAHQRRIERATALLGRPAFLYLTALVVAAWAALNLVLRAQNRTSLDDPPFFWMQGFITLAALLTNGMILITQNRQGAVAVRREQLDLQISLLAEQKITKVIALIEELRRDLPNVHNRVDDEAERMSSATDAKAVVGELDALMGEAAHDIEEEDKHEESAASEVMPSTF